MGLKKKVDAMRVVVGQKACKHGFDLTQVISTLYAYIAELEARLDSPKPVMVKKAPTKKATATKVPTTKVPTKKATAKK